MNPVIMVVAQKRSRPILAETFSFFDFENYQVRNGVETVVAPVDGLRFFDTGLTPAYVSHEGKLVDWLFRSFLAAPAEVWIRPVYGKWLTAQYSEARQDPVYRACKNWLDDHGLKNSFSGFVRLLEPDHVLTRMVAATLRGYTQIELLFPRSQLILAPCDHGEIHVFLGSNCPFRERISQMLIPGVEIAENTLYFNGMAMDRKLETVTVFPTSAPELLKV